MDWQRDIRPTCRLTLTAGLLLPQVLCYPALPCRRKPSRSRREKSSYTSTSAPRPPCRIVSATPASHRKPTGTASPSSIHGFWRRWVCCTKAPFNLRSLALICLSCRSSLLASQYWNVEANYCLSVNRIYWHCVTTSCYVTLFLDAFIQLFRDLFSAQLVLVYSMSNLKGIVHLFSTTRKYHYHCHYVNGGFSNIF